MGGGGDGDVVPAADAAADADGFAELWTLVNGAGLLDAGHPNVASGNGTIDPETIQGRRCMCWRRTRTGGGRW